MSIVLCIPFLKLVPKHEDHIDEFYAANHQKYGSKDLTGAPDPRYLIKYKQYHKALHHVQRNAVNLAQKIGASHVLFTEDDQWGYPVDGLEVLLEADRDVIGFKSYFKEYPYKPLCGRKKFKDGDLIEDPDPRNLVDFVEQGGGPEIQEVDLLTWAFTLVKTSVFDRMAAARKDPFRQWGPHPTDSFFCQYCADLGIPIHVHFGYTIGHGDVAPDEIVEHRRFFEMRQMKKGRIQAAGPQIMRDDQGLPLGWTINEPENGKMLKALEEQDDEPVMYTPEGRVAVI